MESTLSHFTNNYKDFFSYTQSTTQDYVLGDIKPAYSLFVDSLGDGVISLDTYTSGASFKKHYENAKMALNQYVLDIMNESPLIFITKAQLAVFIAKHKTVSYVIKGEFVLRVINDFIAGRIKLGNKTHEDLMDFASYNKPYWKDSLIEMDEITLLLSKEKPLSDYLFLLDRYETYDPDFINNMRTASDIFLF